MTRLFSSLLITALIVISVGFSAPGWTQPTLSLQEAITAALGSDPWLQGSELSEKALLAEAVAAGELPDPLLTIGLANLPTDTLDFDQEAMTQFKVGIAQMFPRGDTLQLRRRQKEEASAVQPFLREDRKASVALKVSLLWMDAFLAQQSVTLIEENRHLFDQLLGITHANYASTQGATRQQDVIRAELELTRLSDRLSTLWQAYDAAQQALAEWLPAEYRGKALPNMLTDGEGLAHVKENRQALVKRIQQHPRIQALDRKIQSFSTDIDLAREQYKPEWGLNAAYSYRDNPASSNSANIDRADFISLGVSIDLPLFTANRQDRRVSAATHRRGAIRIERDLALRELLAEYEKARVELQRLDERDRLYQQQLLPQMRDQADATLASYTSDGGDFSEVMRASIAELNSKIMALEIKVKRQKMIAIMNYFLAISPVPSKNMERKQ